MINSKSLIYDYTKELANHTNIDLIYDYSKDRLKTQNENLDRLNQKLAGVIGFASVLIKFAGDLDDRSFYFINTRIWAICFLLFATFSALIAFRSTFSGNVIKTEELTMDWYHKSNEEIKKFIVQQWVKTIRELGEVGKTRSKYLNISFLCIGLATLMFAINYIL